MAESVVIAHLHEILAILGGIAVAAFGWAWRTSHTVSNIHTIQNIRVDDVTAIGKRITMLEKELAELKGKYEEHVRNHEGCVQK